MDPTKTIERLVRFQGYFADQKIGEFAVHDLVTEVIGVVDELRGTHRCPMGLVPSGSPEGTPLSQCVFFRGHEGAHQTTTEGAIGVMWANVPNDTDTDVAGKPSRLWGSPLAEVLWTSVAEWITSSDGPLANYDPEFPTRVGPWTVREHTVRDHRSHLRLAEWVVDDIIEQADEITEVVDFDKTPEMIDAADRLVELVAAGMTGWMAGEAVADHEVTFDGEHWFCDGERVFVEVPAWLADVLAEPTALAHTPSEEMYRPTVLPGDVFDALVDEIDKETGHG
jgi:hypothetical protein